MGYYTVYTLNTYPPNRELIHDILSALPEEGEFEELFYAVDKDGDTYDECKWYHRERDMGKLSLLHPNVVFDLYGEGEDNGDTWHEYYLNGKMQRCRAYITFAEYDPAKLEEMNPCSHKEE